MKIYKDFAQVLIKRASDLYKDDYLELVSKKRYTPLTVAP